MQITNELRNSKQPTRKNNVRLEMQELKVNYHHMSLGGLVVLWILIQGRGCGNLKERKVGVGRYCFGMRGRVRLKLGKGLIIFLLRIDSVETGSGGLFF